MSFPFQYANIEIEVEPISPHSEQQVRDKLAANSFVGEWHPRHVLKDRVSGDEFAEFKFLRVIKP